MPGGVLEKHIDDSPLAVGTHKRGNNSVTLIDPGADFKSCGVQTDVLIKNITDGSSGTISAVTEDEITGTLSGGTDNDWDVGDEYEIYITDTEDSLISSIWTDKSRGWRSDKQKLDRGWRPGDVDLDRDEKHVFGPGQPEKSYD